MWYWKNSTKFGFENVDFALKDKPDRVFKNIA